MLYCIPTATTVLVFLHYSSQHSQFGEVEEAISLFFQRGHIRGKIESRRNPEGTRLFTDPSAASHGISGCLLGGQCCHALLYCPTYCITMAPTMPHTVCCGSQKPLSSLITDTQKIEEFSSAIFCDVDQFLQNGRGMDGIMCAKERHWLTRSFYQSVSKLIRLTSYGIGASQSELMLLIW